MSRIKQPYPKPPYGGKRNSAAASGKSYRSKSAATGQSMRIKLLGDRTTREMREMFEEAMTRLEDANIFAGRSIYIYLCPLNKDGTPMMARTKTPDLIIKAPYRSAADEYKVP